MACHPHAGICFFLGTGLWVGMVWEHGAAEASTLAFLRSWQVCPSAVAAPFCPCFTITNTTEGVTGNSGNYDETIKLYVKRKKRTGKRNAERKEIKQDGITENLLNLQSTFCYCYGGSCLLAQHLGFWIMVTAFWLIGAHYEPEAICSNF